MKHKRLEKTFKTQFESGIMQNHHVGLMVYDPQEKDTLFWKNAGKYFVPASNIKIFTLYSALELLPERMPALQYTVVGDTLYFEGQADPSALHPHFNDSTLVHFLSAYEHLRFYPYNISTAARGPGWAWEDYDQAFAAERSSLPLYGNLVTVYGDSLRGVLPNLFKDSVRVNPAGQLRAERQNQFTIPEIPVDSINIPLVTHAEMTRALLRQLLQKEVLISASMPREGKKQLSGMARDTLLKRMMTESDNFLAEQLLLSASAILSDTLNSELAIRYMKKGDLHNLEHPPRWVDGSGLSRYNLCTPASLVDVLSRIYLSVGKDQARQFFPVGGVSGTIKDQYLGNPKPYVYAKTGSLGNIYCLSGFLEARSGRLLIFSLLNNHHRLERHELISRINIFLEYLRDKY